MKKMDRIIVYMVGFALGTLLVSVIMTRRAAREEAATDPWVEQNQAMVAAGAEPLPENVPDSMRSGRIIDFGYLPDEANPQEKVWLLNFDKSYPYVRMVQSVAGGDVTFMAADQITIRLAEGVDVTELKPMLDQLGLRLRMFNRKEHVAVIGVLHTRIDAVPATIAAVQPWARLFSSAEPDVIQFKRPENSE